MTTLTLTSTIKDKLFESISFDYLKSLGQKMISYEELGRGAIKQIEELDGFIIHTPIENKNSGHYVCLWFDTDFKKLHYFDPFGFSPFETVRKSIYMYQTPQRDEDYFINLILDYKKRGGIVLYNQKQFQNLDTATCGRHCIIRLLYRHLSDKEYEEFLKYRNISSDNLVTLMTIYM